MIHQVLIGFAVGIFIATAGWYRERRFEPFSWLAYSKSVIVSMFFGAVSVSFGQVAWYLTVTWCAAMERLVLEGYKTYVKPGYRPHVVCDVCHCSVYSVIYSQKKKFFR